MKTVARLLIETLLKHNIKKIFGVPSGNWVDYLDIINQFPEMDFILVSNEASAGFMADVYWRLTGEVAACFGTFGPGACNLSTGVCGGYLDRSPMLVFTDEVPDEYRNRTMQMHIDHQQLFKPITKWTTRLEVSNMEGILISAIELAKTETPGPVHIGLPAGIGKVVLPMQHSLKTPLPPQVQVLNSACLSTAERALNKAKQPIIVIGNTANRFDIKAKIISLAEQFHWPVVLTPMAKGNFPESHPLYAGVLAHAMSHWVARIHQQADLIVAIGYDPVEINLEDWSPHVPIIDINSEALYIDPLKYMDSVNLTDNQLSAIDVLLKGDYPKSSWDLALVEQYKNELFAAFKESEPDLHICRVLDCVRQCLPDDGIMTCDVGAHLHLIGQQWMTPEPGRQLMTNGCSSMGFAIPAAIAAKLAKSNQQVCCITGDGGFAMMVGELLTAKRLNLAITFIVLVDNSLSLIRLKQQRKGFEEKGVELNTADEATNQYFGIKTNRVSQLTTLFQILKKSFSSQGVKIIEVPINSEDYESLLLKGNRTKNDSC